MIFVVDDLLQGQALQRAKELALKATYISGKATAAYDAEIKHNREMEVGEDYLELTELVVKAIESCDKIQNRICPRYWTNPIFNRFDVGMYYREHIDGPVQGAQTQLGKTPGRFGQNFIRTDYSMTLFLMDPDRYDGGELEIRVSEKSELFKLPAGSAVFYMTGIPHQVRPVTRGARIASICWFQSMIKNLGLRRVLWDQHCLAQQLAANGQTELAEQAEGVKMNLVRYLADI